MPPSPVRWLARGRPFGSSSAAGALIRAAPARWPRPPSRTVCLRPIPGHLPTTMHRAPTPPDRRPQRAIVILACFCHAHAQDEPRSPPALPAEGGRRVRGSAENNPSDRSQARPGPDVQGRKTAYPTVLRLPHTNYVRCPEAPCGVSSSMEHAWALLPIYRIANCQPATHVRLPWRCSRPRS